MDQLIKLESETHEAFVGKQHLLAVFIDLKQAFDLTWRYSILSQLAEWKTTGRILDFVQNIQNILTNRSFKVRINQNLSPTKSMENGIPQGSPISVTRFLIVINYIIKVVKRPAKCLLFAVDITIICRITSLQLAESAVQKTLNNITEWTKITGFQISTEKTQAMHFTKLRGAHLTPTLSLENKNVQVKTPSNTWASILIQN